MISHKLLNVSQKCFYKSACIFFKIFKMIVDVDFISPVLRQNQNYNLRSNHSGSLVNSVPQTVFRERAPNDQFTRIWNELPSELKEVEKYEVFKRRIHKHSMHID